MKRIAIATLGLALLPAAAGAEITLQRLDLGPHGLAELQSVLHLAAGVGKDGLDRKEDEEGERQYLIPYWTSSNGSGVTTLFGLTNCHPVAILTQVEYFDSTWNLRHSTSVNLPANGLRTFNVRDLIGEGISLDGVVRITSSEKIMVDAAKVEPGAQRAAGTGALRYGGKYGDVVPAVAGRAFQGGALGLGTVFTLFVTAPQGAGAADPPTLIVLVHDQDGLPVAGVLLRVSQVVGSLDFSELAAAVGFAGIDAKLVFLGNSAAVAAALGIEPPSEDVQVGGWVIQNAGSQYNTADKLRRTESPL